MLYKNTKLSLVLGLAAKFYIFDLLKVTDIAVKDFSQGLTAIEDCIVC